jgi:DNA-binding CsgD family transcriptional regulator/tetratricopeptide (TPR) repeat protein
VPTRVSSPEFVGRATELERLEAALDRAADGTAAAVFVGGESGIGKTRLLRELERRAVDRGARVLRGDCLAFGADGLPYAPIAAALRGLARDLSPSAFEELVGPGAGDLARLLPELSVSHAPEEPAEGVSGAGDAIAQARLFGLLRTLLDRLAAEAPVLFAIEDIHWADRSTLEFLSSLLRGLRDERLLLVCTYRSDELHRQHPLRPFLAEEERRHVVERVAVAPFSQAELAEQVAGILGSAAEPGLVARLHARTEGNAFFAEELLAASDAAAGSLPSKLRDVLNLRLEALPDDARSVLRVAAAAGRRSDHRLLAAVAGLPEPALVQALREALAQHVLVQDDDGYAFRHALLQEAAYADLLPGERTALHLALAEALRDDPTLAAGTAAGELALHWRAAHRMPEALAAYVRAGLEAEQVFAFVEAAQHFERALEIWDLVEDAGERSELQLGDVVAHAANNMDIAGEHHRAVTLGRMALELADRAGDVVASALARERLGRSLWLAGDSDGALAAYRDAVRVLPPEPPTAELARVLAAEAQILMLRAPGDEPRAACEHAIEVARAVGAKATEGHATNSLGVTKMGAGDFEGSERALRDAMRIAEEVTDLDGIWRAYTNLSECLDEQGRVGEAAELALVGADKADRLGMRSYAQFLQGEACWRLTRLGRLDETGAIVERVLAEGPKGVAAVVLHDNAAHLAMRRGRLDEATEHFALARELLGDTRDSMWIGNQSAGRAETALWAGDPERAWQLATGALELVPTDQYAHYTSRLHATALRAAADRAQRALALGDREGAAEAQRDARAISVSLRALLAPERWHAGVPGPEPAAFDALGAAELARADGYTDPAAWAATAERFAALEEPFELGYARWRQAEALIVAGADRTAAANALREAADIAATLRAPLLAAEVEGLAKRARVVLDAAATEPLADDPGLDRLGLTDRELTVLELLSEGHTNREIGETLFISEKTASVHVSRILAKLGVRSRVEAATAAHRLGLTAASAPGNGRRG